MTLAVLQYTYDDWQAMYVGLYPNREDLQGDVNNDGNVDINDVTLLIKLLLTGQADGNAHADVNVNGSADINDVTILISYLLNGSW